MNNRPATSGRPETTVTLVPTVHVFSRLLASGLDPATALERLQKGMDEAGYPRLYPNLSPIDADDILTAILRPDTP